MIYYEEEGITLHLDDWREIDPKLLKADCLISDPPYGIGESSKNHMSRGKPFGTKATNSRAKQMAYGKDYGTSDWDDEPPSAEEIERMRSLAKYQIIFGGNYFHLPPSRCWFVWDKVNGESDFADCELIWTNLDSAVRLFRFMWNGMLREGDDVRVHPTQKPYALLCWLLTRLPQDVKSIVDPYCGSGTSLVAARALGLKAIGVEREEKYAKEIVERLRQQIITFDPIDKAQQ